MYSSHVKHVIISSCLVQSRCLTVGKSQMVVTGIVCHVANHPTWKLVISAPRPLAGRIKPRCSSKGAYCSACFINFSLIRETAGIRKKQWFKYLRQPFLLFFFCNLDGSGKVLKLLCDVWKEVIFKMQKIVQVLSCDCLGDRCHK